MAYFSIKWRTLAAVAAAAGLAACGDDGTTTTPATSPPTQGIAFSVFTNQLFSDNANATPVAVNGVNFYFDVDDTPDAFQALIASGMY
jgi:ABC-type glycerol-3-phosphate transport system substrate-binding protein